MLKIFHNNFFENLSDPIPAFLSTKKFGLLMEVLPHSGSGVPITIYLVGTFIPKLQ